VSVDALCPGCKQSLASHPRSGRSVPGQTDGIVVVHGRCIVSGVRAPQKLCWSLLAGPLTLDEYLDLYRDRRPPAPPCPACGGPTGYHDTYERYVAEDSADPTLVPMYRFRCRRADCPVVTITLYPVFITPYMPVPTQMREDAVRAHDEGRMSWERIAEAVGVASDTVRRWARRLRARVPDLAAAFMAAVAGFDPTANLPPARAGPSLWALGDAAAGAVGFTPWPRLAVGRLDLSRGPMPVWA
jgi:hypothetical protein